MSNYLARIYIDENGVKEEQLLKDHSRECAETAANDLQPSKLSATGKLSGVLHDAGKYTDECQNYLKAAASGCEVKKGSVIHTFQGVAYILEKYHNVDALASELIAYAIGSHHGQFDCVSPDRSSGFQHRLNTNTDKATAIKRLYADCISEKEIDSLFYEAKEEIEIIYKRIFNLVQSSNVGKKDEKTIYEETFFYIAMLARLIQSAVMDGDRRSAAAATGGNSTVSPKTSKKVWEKKLAHIKRELSKIPAKTPVDKARKKISEMCELAAKQDGSVFTLNIPTGSGKTLSATRFALALAVEQDKARIIYVAPLLSILDQNSKVIRKYIDDDSIILEHHSNVVREDFGSEELAMHDLLADTWDAPIIVTTLFQLLMTMFSGKTSAIRRFHSLQNSIIIIDEVQSIPSNMLSLFNGAVNFISEICGAKVILCTATQPQLDKTTRPLSVPIKDIVPYDKKLWDAFKRTDLVDAGAKKLSEIPVYVKSALTQCNSVLLVCNTKSEAEYIYSEVKVRNVESFCITTSMCMQHRLDALEQLFYALDQSRKGGKKVLCISTQLLQAGVDASFERPLRIGAGLDDDIQVAGRGNRNGESPVPVKADIITCIDENLYALQDIQRAKDAASGVINAFRTNPSKFDHALDSEKSIKKYYENLYAGMPKGHQDYIVESTSIYEMLSMNSDFADENCAYLNDFVMRQAFKTAGDLFKVFDNESIDIVVPYGDGKKLIQEIKSAGQKAKNQRYLKNWLSRAKPFTISLFENKIKKIQAGDLEEVADGIFVLSKQCYDENTGFTLEKHLEFLEA